MLALINMQIIISNKNHKINAIWKPLLWITFFLKKEIRHNLNYLGIVRRQKGNNR